VTRYRYGHGLFPFLAGAVTTRWTLPDVRCVDLAGVRGGRSPGLRVRLAMTESAISVQPGPAFFEGRARTHVTLPGKLLPDIEASKQHRRVKRGSRRGKRCGLTARRMAHDTHMTAAQLGSGCGHGEGNAGIR
jgi:hypothetical protein